MKKSKKKPFKIAFLLCGAGIVIALIGLFAVGFDVKKISTVIYETNTYEVTEKFNNIIFEDNRTEIPEVRMLLSVDGNCKVVCYEDRKETHTVRVENNSLIISKEDTRKWYDYIRVSFNDEEPKLTLYLPEDIYRLLEGK